MADAIIEYSTLGSELSEALSSLVNNWDDNGFPELECDTCNIADHRIKANMRCPFVDEKLATRKSFKISKCPGWYFSQPGTWELREILTLSERFGDITNKSNIIAETLLLHKKLVNYNNSVRLRAQKEKDNGT